MAPHCLQDEYQILYYGFAIRFVIWVSALNITYVPFPTTFPLYVLAKLNFSHFIYEEYRFSKVKCLDCHHRAREWQSHWVCLTRQPELSFAPTAPLKNKFQPDSH